MINICSNTTCVLRDMCYRAAWRHGIAGVRYYEPDCNGVCEKYIDIQKEDTK